MAQTKSIQLTVLCLTLTVFICHLCDANDLDFADSQYSDYLRYELISEGEHYLNKRNTDDDVKLKKTSIIKKPIGTSKVDAFQKPTPIKSLSISKNATTEDMSSHANANITFYDDDVEQTDLPPNANRTIDYHTYYNSTFYTNASVAMSYWVNITSYPKHQSVTHEMLSNSHRRAATVSLPFDFPFYGHPLKNITIATGGFLYVGDHVHSWLAATQYIAALMANFDTSLSNSSTIQYAYNDTAFIVQWSDVMLQDKTNEGSFSFQIILLKNGDIVFVYKEVPIPIQELPDSKHPVKVGISDAYIIDRTVFFIRRKTIYEYHRADLKKLYDISNNTAIYFKALPTCNSLQTCEACLSANIGFECGWCDVTQRCSDGFDRHRQDWIIKNCEVISKEAKCAANLSSTTAAPNATSSVTQTVTPAVPGERQFDIHDHNESNPAHYNHAKEEVHHTSGGNAGVISFLIIVAFLSGIALWVFYAYKNPQSSSGQILIKYRPSQWRWNSSEARYTAASIHM